MRILLLAYHFPPIGGAGVQRTVKMARYLRELDVEPTIITGPGHSRGRWTPEDGSLADDVAAVVVHRVPGPEPTETASPSARAERWLRSVSAWSQWWVEGLIEAAARMDTAVDIVVATMSPFQTAEAARVIASRRGVPWVADLRDPWALDEMQVYPTRWHARLERRHMRRALSSASAIVMNTSESEKRLREAFPNSAEYRSRRSRTGSIPPTSISAPSHAMTVPSESSIPATSTRKTTGVVAQCDGYSAAAILTCRSGRGRMSTSCRHSSN